MKSNLESRLYSLSGKAGDPEAGGSEPVEALSASCLAILFVDRTGYGITTLRLYRAI